MRSNWVGGIAGVVLMLAVAAPQAQAQGWGWNGGWNSGWGWNGGWNAGWNDGWGWNGGWNGWNGGWNGWNGGWNPGWGWNGGWTPGPVVPPVVTRPTVPGYVPLYPGDAFGNNFGDRVYGGTHYPGLGVVNGVLPARPSGVSGNGPYNPSGGVFPGNGMFSPGAPNNRR
ncbi:MAG: hypothetical protein KatS3mg108_3858 [Isosphaeraceae bacterium]|jgi:hypothetical protein|nr:MAG: hypothetical protein KatS3mg108_3858 [Isosphaeraceae bacterium]